MSGALRKPQCSDDRPLPIQQRRLLRATLCTKEQQFVYSHSIDCMNGQGRNTRQPIGNGPPEQYCAIAQLDDMLSSKRLANEASPRNSRGSVKGKVDTDE
jgi:hypothetical protein